MTTPDTENDPPRDEWIRRYIAASAALTPAPDPAVVKGEAEDVWRSARGDVSPEEAARLADEQTRLLGGTPGGLGR